MSTSLYSLSKGYLDTFNRLESVLNNSEATPEEVLEVSEELEINEENIKEKSLNYLQYIKSVESDVLGINAEIERLKALKDSKQRVIDALGNRLKISLISLSMDKLDLGIFKLSIRKSQSTDTKTLEKNLKELDLQNILDSNFSPASIIEKIKESELLKSFVDFLNIDVSFSVNKTKVKSFLEEKETNKLEGCFLDKKQNLQIK